MDDVTKAVELSAGAPATVGTVTGTKTGLERKAGLFRRFPTIAHLRRRALAECAPETLRDPDSVQEPLGWFESAGYRGTRAGHR